MVSPISSLGTPAQTLAYTEGAKDDLSNLTAPTAVNQDILPSITLNFNLGSPAFQWARVYPAGILTGEDPGDTVDLTAYDTNTNTETTFMRFTAGNPPTAEIYSAVFGTTQPFGTNTTQIATCAFVQAAIAGGPAAATVQVNAASQAMAVSTTYIVTYGGGVCTLTLPAGAAFGAEIRIIGGEGISNAYVIAQLASQFIRVINNVTTTGVGGSLTADNRYNSITLKCTDVAGTGLTWSAIPNGTFTGV